MYHCRQLVFNFSVDRYSHYLFNAWAFLVWPLSRSPFKLVSVFFCMTPSCFEYFLAFWYNKLFQAYLSPPQHQKQPFISPRSPSSKIWRQEVLLIPGLLSRHTHVCVCTRAKRYPPLPSSLSLAIPGYLSMWTPSSFCWPSHFPVETPSSSHQATPPPPPYSLHSAQALVSCLGLSLCQNALSPPPGSDTPAFPTQRWFTTPSCLFPGMPSSSRYVVSDTLFWATAASLPLMALAQNCSGRTRIKALLKFYRSCITREMLSLEKIKAFDCWSS